MRATRPWRTEKLSFARKAVRASASVTKKKNSIHCVTEVDISRPRRLLEKCGESLGHKPSFTGYIASCLSRTMARHPDFNAFIRGNRIVYLDRLTISILVEREIGGEAVPEPIGVADCQGKSFREISDEIRGARKRADDRLGAMSGLPWLSHIPGFLLAAFVSLADKTVFMALKYGKVAITSVGMFSTEALWFVPHGSATVLLTIGSIIPRVVETEAGFETKEHLCLTVTFDHDIIDGAPAARFMNDLLAEIKSGDEVRKLLEAEAGDGSASP